MKPVLVVNPRADADFATHVTELVDAGAGSAEQLESRLRALYPHAIVRRRLLSGELAETWYIYREGTWIPNDVEMRKQTSKPLPRTWSTMHAASKPSRT